MAPEDCHSSKNCNRAPERFRINLFEMTENEKSPAPAPASPVASPPGEQASSPSSPPRPDATTGILPPEHWAEVAQGQVCNATPPNRCKTQLSPSSVLLPTVSCLTNSSSRRPMTGNRTSTRRPRPPRSRQAFFATGQSMAGAIIARSEMLNTGNSHPATIVNGQYQVEPT